MAVLHVNTDKFKSGVLEEKLPVLVDFYADWCGPCRAVSPIIEELSREFEGKIKFVKINVDDSSDIAIKYSVMSIPNLMFFKQGEILEQIVGALTKQQLKAKIQQHI